MRCHIPPFLYRFYHEGVSVQEASVCWRCNNIFGITGGQKWVFEFDSSHTASQRLLTETRRVTGIVAEG